MTNDSRRICGAIILTVPTIAYGGYFLLTILSGDRDYVQLTEFQRSMFRAGHAHAGVLVILALIAQILIDHANLSTSFRWFARLAFPLAAILISAGFFAAAIGQGSTGPSSLIAILYVGVSVFVAGLITLGIGLLRGTNHETLYDRR